MKISKAGSLLAACLLVMELVLTGHSFAASSFYQNKIIDDGVFDNVSTMNAGQIDSFLNSFPNSCISPNSTFLATDPTGYSKSAGYTYGSNVTAGKVIYDAAQAYSINPQVLLATLQKEQSLVTGSAGCSNPNIYVKAVGYGCPDSYNSYSYSGLNLFTKNGITYTSVSGVCVNTAAKAGFAQQVIHAAWLLKYGEARSEGKIGWAVIKGSWNNSDDLSSCYSGPMTQGNYARCPNSSTAYYDGYTTIDSTAVHMDDGATAALYWYTPHFHGNQSFYSIFTGWFGSAYNRPAGMQASSSSNYANSDCGIVSFDTTQVARLYQPDTQDFLYTTSSSEACAAVRYGYIWDGIVMQSVPTSDPNAIPVYRLANLTNHLFTTSSSVRDSYETQYGYHDEGIGFYVYGSAVAGSIPVTELTDGYQTFFFTSAASEASYYTDVYGFSSFGTAFYTPNMNTVPAGSVSVERLTRNNQRMYTASPLERNLAVANYGFSDEGVVSQGDLAPNTNNAPVYRLRSSYGSYFYTLDRKERDLAIINYGYFSEGIGFYELRWSNSPVYRLKQPQSPLRLFTNNSYERSQAVSKYNYSDEGAGWYSY